jgi:hypothetical protein
LAETRRDPKAAVYFEEALQLAARSGDTHAELWSLFNLTRFNFDRDLAAALEHGEQLRARAVETGRRDLELESYGLLFLIYRDRAELAKAKRTLQSMEELANRSGQAVWAARALMRTADLALLGGEVTEAADLLEQANRGFAQAGRTDMAEFSREKLAEIAWLKGDLAGVREQIVSAKKDNPGGGVALWGAIFESRIAVKAGDLVAARRALDHANDALGKTPLDRARQVRLGIAAAELEAKSGAVDRALGALTQLADQMSHETAERFRVELEVFRGELAVAYRMPHAARDLAIAQRQASELGMFLVAGKTFR